MKNILLSFSFLFSVIFLQAQEADKTDFLSNNGKIYVVVAILSVVFLGIILFLIYLERRINKIEIQINNE